MRNAFLTLLLVLSAASTHALTPPGLSPFFPPQALDIILDGAANDTTPADDDDGDLRKRQSGCADGYSNCYQLSAPALCCRPDSVCSADPAGNIGCCPLGALCTGTIGEPVGATAPPVSSTGGSLTGFVFPSTTSVVAQGTSQGGFVISPAPTAGGAGRARGLFGGALVWCCVVVMGVLVV